MILVVLGTAVVMLAFAGLVVSFAALHDAKADRWYTQHFAHVGTKFMIANSNIRRERLRASELVMFFVAGCIGLRYPFQESFTGVRSIASACVIIAEVTIIINTVSDRRDRRAINDEIDRQQKDGASN